MTTNISNAAKVAKIHADAYDDMGTPIWFQMYNEKFAELIVKECLFIVDDERKPEMVSSIELWKQIAEHFGVQ